MDLATVAGALTAMGGKEGRWWNRRRLAEAPLRGIGWAVPSSPGSYAGTGGNRRHESSLKGTGHKGQGFSPGTPPPGHRVLEGRWQPLNPTHTARHAPPLTVSER